MFMPQQHTGKNIAEASSSTGGLEHTCLTTDSGSNVINAAERLQLTRLPYFAHNLHGVTNALKSIFGCLEL